MLIMGLLIVLCYCSRKVISQNCIFYLKACHSHHTVKISCMGSRTLQEDHPESTKLGSWGITEPGPPIRGHAGAGPRLTTDLLQMCNLVSVWLP